MPESFRMAGELNLKYTVTDFPPPLHSISHFKLQDVSSPMDFHPPQKHHYLPNSLLPHAHFPSNWFHHEAKSGGIRPFRTKVQHTLPETNTKHIWQSRRH
ncbi:unnamed protein product [Didymodactylos carnosus]|uniref:Uncharacterized protein n=1 Tax=Didymodactylos carnosus TaxID=1234261 RepID=A0A814TT66_9BILA|nr:unnamed protein product [Didymodactylos carnosus]CAF1166470.1 unnamed protein product [Didymodactylos carnosus]CAF3930058.1 unnamed protein product [Didymodactylos carnosus]CAF3972755.1 unnamed protein product [Didymodactylos carnosus]